jgi:phosphoribosyl 1,2-cyclic phosphate phosphodiesterase
MHLSPRSVSVLVLGSGTSTGVPTIGCDCPVCTSADPRDQRLRPSVLVRSNGRNFLVDTTPDFRAQALRARIQRIDAILFTHDHADPILGLDDVRPYNYHQGPIPIFAAEDTMASVRRVFRYIFEGRSESSVPRLEVHTLNGGPFCLFGVEITPVPLRHGTRWIYGFRFGPVAYLTDHSEIPEESMALLGGLDVLFLDALRHRPHPTHTTVAQALSYVERLRPKSAVFTHLSHELEHAATQARLPEGVHLAYDGLEVCSDEAKPL